MTETFEIHIRNHKSEPFTVFVQEPLYRWSNWEIIQASAKYEKYDANTIRFPVKVDSNGEQIVTYTVRHA